MVLDGLNAVGARLFALLAHDDERSTVFVLSVCDLWFGHDECVSTATATAAAGDGDSRWPCLSREKP